MTPTERLAAAGITGDLPDALECAKHLAPALYREIATNTNRIWKSSWEEYRTIEGQHATHLRAMLESPLHYHYRDIHPRIERPCLSLGIHAHAVTLEPETLDGSVEVWTGKVKHGKAWDAFEAAAVAAGHRIVTVKEHEAAEHVADAVHGHPLASTLLVAGVSEISMQWTEPLCNDEPCKGRIDWLTEKTPAMTWLDPFGVADGTPLLVGLKTSATPMDRPFRTAAEKYGYILQWGMYARGHELCAGGRGRTIEIVIGSTPPYEVFVYLVPEDVIDDGLKQYTECIDGVQSCRASGLWPGRGEGGPVVFERADWAVAQDDPGLDFSGMEAA